MPIWRVRLRPPKRLGRPCVSLSTLSFFSFLFGSCLFCCGSLLWVWLCEIYIYIYIYLLRMGQWYIVINLNYVQKYLYIPKNKYELIAVSPTYHILDFFFKCCIPVLVPYRYPYSYPYPCIIDYHHHNCLTPRPKPDPPLPNPSPPNPTIKFQLQPFIPKKKKKIQSQLRYILNH